MADVPASRAAAAARKPAWLKVKAPAAGAFRATGAVLDDLRLHTVCDEARCPNKGECFSAGTATFLILGDVCTRDCGFCAVEHAGRRRRLRRPASARPTPASRRVWPRPPPGSASRTSSSPA